MHRRVFSTLSTFILFAGLFVGTTATAHAAPYGGCAEAWQAPKSPGAAWCKARGWTVTKRVVIGPRGVLRAERLPDCRHEDGSGGRRPCVWNGASAGNGTGLSYIVKRNHRVRYVWMTSPVKGTAWRWVDSGLADALASGGSRGATRRPWERCITRDTTVLCPDGHRENWG